MEMIIRIIVGIFEIMGYLIGELIESMTNLIYENRGKIIMIIICVIVAIVFANIAIQELSHALQSLLTFGQGY